MIILVVAEEGGTGKSTVASNITVHLVRQSADVILVDTDGQTTCARSSGRRDEAGIGPTVSCIQRVSDVAATLCDLPWRYQVIVVDVGGRDSYEIRSVVAVSNLLLVPTRISQADLETLPKVNKLVSLVRGLNSDLKASMVLSMAPSNPTIRGVDDVRGALSQFDQLELVDTIIRDRKVYRGTLLNGNGVVELSNSQVHVEIRLLTQESFEAAAQT